MSESAAAPATFEAPWGGFEALCWTLSAVLLVSVAAYGLLMSWRWRKITNSHENFVTARNQVHTWRLAWSFFAGAIGAWVIASPSSYASFAGMIGLVFYSLASGLPVLLIAFCGPLIERKLPHALSLSDFMGWRFGYGVKTFVMCLALLNMSIAMLAEYVTIGSLFNVYLGSVGYPMIIVVGLLTLSYTTVGGLLVSIATDQVQGITSLALMLFVAIYMAATFRADLPPANFTSTIKGTTEYGYSAIFVMPLSLTTATIFSEAMWQRAWAASSPSKLKAAAWIGATGICLVVFVSGLVGWLAAWADLIPYDVANPNLYMFYGLDGAVNLGTQTINNWIGVVVLLLAVVMNEGAVDSLQNGMVAAASSHLKDVLPWLDRTLPQFKGYPLIYTRSLVLSLNIVLIVLGAIGSTSNWAVIDLFLISNMLCATAAFPVILGVFDGIGWPTKSYKTYLPLHPYYGGGSVLTSWFISFFLTSVFGVNECWGDDLIFDADYFVWQCVPSGASGTSSFSAGMTYTWYRNGYRWQYFAVASGTSIGAALLCIAFNYVVYEVLKVGRPAVPGFIAHATHPDLVKDTESDDSGEFKKDGDGGEKQPKKKENSMKISFFSTKKQKSAEANDEATGNANTGEIAVPSIQE